MFDDHRGRSAEERISAERKSPAIGMRLRSVGVNYHIVDSRFAPLARGAATNLRKARDAAKSHRIDSSHSAPRQEFRESVTH